MKSTRPFHNRTKLTSYAFAALTAGLLTTFATSAVACRIPWRFVPANETHDVVVVATAVRRDDWGRFDYDTGFPVIRETGEPFRMLHAREWTAELRTLWSLKGDAPGIIQVSPDITPNGGTFYSSCWDGVETPQPGVTYAVYLDWQGNALTTTRLVNIDFALKNDPLFSSRTPLEAPDP